MGWSEETVERLRGRVQAYRHDIIEFERRLVATPALGPDNGGEGEWDRSRFLISWCDEVGLGPVEELNAPDPRVPAFQRPNLVVRVPGGDGPAVVVLSHTDVVPPGNLEAWTGDPYELRQDGDRLIGRGVEDNGQGVTTSLFAARALLDEGLEPPGDVVLLLVADEETGNRFGVDHLLEHHPDLVTARDLVIVPDFGLPDGLAIEIAEKSVLMPEITVLGRQVHASMPDAGVNAHRVAAHFVVRLEERLAAAFPDADPVFDPPRSTFEPTKRLANVPNINTIPGEERFYLDCRVLPGTRLEEVESVLREVGDEVEAEFGARIEIDYAAKLSAAPPTPDDAPVVRLLGEAVLAARGERARTIGIGGGTVAAAFRRRGIPAAVWSTMDDTAHQPDEYALVSNLLADALVFSLAFLGER